MSDPQRYETIVVGGGFAGVCAARDLAAAGRSVLLLEARDRLGGRVESRPFKGRRELIELGGGWISPKYHPLVARELGRYDLRLAESHAGALETVWHLDGARSRTLPFVADDMYELERVLYRIKTSAYRIDLSVPRDRQDLADLDIPISAYLDALGLKGRPRAFIDMWTSLGSGALQQEWSALGALSLIAAMDCSVYGWYGAVTEKFEVGTSGVIARMIEGSGVTVQLSCPVQAVDQTGDDVRVTLRDGRSYRADALVLATPLACWPDIDFRPALSPGKLEAARIGHRGRMKKVWMLVEGGPPAFYASGSGPDFVQMFPEHTDGDRRIVVGFLPPPSPIDPTDLDALTRAVRQYVDGVTVIASDFVDFEADEFLRGSWMVQPPGVLSRFASELVRPEGRIAFAGADIATNWLGWIEGAFETGLRAAAEVVRLREGPLAG